MNDRLEPLCFLPPPIGAPSVGRITEQNRYEIKRANGKSVPIESPLFWYEPRWCQTDPATADVIATAVATEGVVVSALAADLVVDDETVTFLQHDVDESNDGEPEFPLPRMVPYRPERYGLQVSDFDDARMIDVRLNIHRDRSGRFAYSSEQMHRWEAAPDDEQPMPDHWTPAASFLPDVASIDHLGAKLNQLRALSPGAALFVSIAPHRMESEIPKLLAAKPDGMILNLDELPLTGMELGQVTRRAREILFNQGAAGFPLWLVPGEITPDDAVKLIVLGASGIAIDHWCRNLLDDAVETIESSPAARLGHERQWELEFPLIQELVQETLGEDLRRFRGLLHRMRCLPAAQRIGSLDQQWAKAFQVPLVSIGQTQQNPNQSQPTEDS
jgi:hypothetical protein